MRWKWSAQKNQLGANQLYSGLWPHTVALTPKVNLSLLLPKASSSLSPQIPPPSTCHLPKSLFLPVMPEILSPHENILSPSFFTPHHFTSRLLSEPARSACFLTPAYKAQNNLPPLSPITPLYDSLPTRQVLTLSLLETQSFCSD